MPVALPELEPAGDAPKPPRPIVWLGVFVIVMLAGVVVALFTWPDDEPPHTAWFWIRLLVLPALTGCALVGLGLHYYDEELDRRQAQREVRVEDREKALRFASEPLAVLDYAYLTGPGSADIAARIASGELVLSAETSAAGIDAVRQTALQLKEGAELSERYRACFSALLEQISASVVAIPSKVPLNVLVHLPVDMDRESLLDLWQSCWRAMNLRPVKATLLAAAPGVMIVDEWLDIRGGPCLEKVALIVSVQLHDAPPQSSAEAAVGVLLAWAPLAERCGLRTQALLHRPVEVGADGWVSAVSKALLWGKTSVNEVCDVWQAGLSRSDKGALLQTASDAGLGVSQIEGFAGVHDVDFAIGHPGVSAGWLAMALGVEHGVETGSPQLIAWREEAQRLAVIRSSQA